MFDSNTEEKVDVWFSNITGGWGLRFYDEACIPRIQQRLVVQTGNANALCVYAITCMCYGFANAAPALTKMSWMLGIVSLLLFAASCWSHENFIGWDGKQGQVGLAIGWVAQPLGLYRRSMKIPGAYTCHFRLNILYRQHSCTKPWSEQDIAGCAHHHGQCGGLIWEVWDMCGHMLSIHLVLAQNN